MNMFNKYFINTEDLIEMIERRSNGRITGKYYGFGTFFTKEHGSEKEIKRAFKSARFWNARSYAYVSDKEEYVWDTDICRFDAYAYVYRRVLKYIGRPGDESKTKFIKRLYKEIRELQYDRFDRSYFWANAAANIVTALASRWNLEIPDWWYYEVEKQAREAYNAAKEAC